MPTKPLIRRVSNRTLHMIARFAPGATNLRPYLHKLRGVRIHGKVFIGEEVYLENEYPESVEIHEGAGIALRTTIVSHFRGQGSIIIGKNVWIGACSTIASRVGQVLTIGEAAVLAANSVVTSDIPPYTYCRGAPAKPIARVTVPCTVGYDYAEFKAGLRPLRK
jgi:acetyltransferase-like isoleucine patch superfamily enzyme